MTCWLALTAVTGYLFDAIGLGVQPWLSLAAGLGLAGTLTYFAARESEAGVADAIAWLGIVVFVAATLLRMSWPSLLPPGRGPDLTHHLLLVDYIEQQHHLVHDRSLSGAMGEMAHYTPASHLLAVMAGRWTGRDGLHTFFPLDALAAALTAGFVFLIARRISLSLPFAISATALLFLPAQYFFGAFTHDSFLAQTVSTLFAVAAWWALTAWEDLPVAALASLIAIFLSATFLSWPIWIGPPLFVFLAMSLNSRAGADVPPFRRSRLWHLLIVVLPLVVVFLLHSWDRWGWMVIVRTSGAVLHPSVSSLGWFLPLIAAIGVICAMSDRRSRVTVVLLLVIGLQALTLFIIAKAQGADTPYMAFKMVYLAIYPMAVLGALAMARLMGATPVADSIGWVLAAALVAAAARPALATPLAVPAVSEDLYHAGKWIRANVGSTCADYLVSDPETAYWLHLAVLGNPRSTERMRELDRYDPRAAMAPWITAEGRSYAIADLRLLPAEIRSRVQILKQIGNAAVISRPDATIKGCD